MEAVAVVGSLPKMEISELAASRGSHFWFWRSLDWDIN